MSSSDTRHRTACERGRMQSRRIGYAFVCRETQTLDHMQGAPKGRKKRPIFFSMCIPACDPTPRFARCMGSKLGKALSMINASGDGPRAREGGTGGGRGGDREVGAGRQTTNPVLGERREDAPTFCGGTSDPPHWRGLIGVSPHGSRQLLPAA
jgi:hypothetical protein